MKHLIKTNKDKTWILIEDIETLFKHIDKQSSSNNLFHLYENLMRNERHPSNLPDNMENKASYIAHYNTLILDILKNSDIIFQNQIKSFQQHGFIWINKNNGYNSIEKFIPNEELIITDLDFSFFINSPIAKSKILFLEHSKEIDKYWLHSIQRKLYDKKYDIEDIENYSHITMLRENMEENNVIPFIEQLIRKYEKITICFSTTQDALYEGQLSLFAAYKDHINEIIFHGGEQISKQFDEYQIKNTLIN